MLLFSGVFFTLGYVMGRNQYDMQVRAAIRTKASSKADTHPTLNLAKTRSPRSQRAAGIIRLRLPKVLGTLLFEGLFKC